MRSLLFLWFVGIFVPCAALADPDVIYYREPAEAADLACKDRLVKVWFTFENVTRVLPDGTQISKWSGTGEACIDPEITKSIRTYFDLVNAVKSGGEYVIRDMAGRSVDWSWAAVDRSGRAIKWAWGMVVPAANAR